MVKHNKFLYVTRQYVSRPVVVQYVFLSATLDNEVFRQVFSMRPTRRPLPTVADHCRPATSARLSNV